MNTQKALNWLLWKNKKKTKVNENGEKKGKIVIDGGGQMQERERKTVREKLPK